MVRGEIKISNLNLKMKLKYEELTNTLDQQCCYAWIIAHDQQIYSLNHHTAETQSW